MQELGSDIQLRKADVLLEASLKPHQEEPKRQRSPVFLNPKFYILRQKPFLPNLAGQDKVDLYKSQGYAELAQTHPILL